MEGGTVKAILTISIYVIACDALVVDTSSWTVETRQSVTSYRAVTTARSRLDCLVRCRGSQGCGLTVFDAATGLCYLQPTLSAADGDNGLPADVCLNPSKALHHQHHHHHRRQRRHYRHDYHHISSSPSSSSSSSSFSPHVITIFTTVVILMTMIVKEQKRMTRLTTLKNWNKSPTTGCRDWCGCHDLCGFVTGVGSV